jgi:D-ornithine 4,5-aminomutase subunit beta
MGLSDPQVIHARVLHPAEGSVFEIKGVVDLPMRADLLTLPEQVEALPHDEIEAFVRPRNLHVVAATVGEDEHSVGLQEVLDIKHGGIERYGFTCHSLGTSVAVDRVLDEAAIHGAHVVLISTILTHGDVHKKSMEQLHRLAVERGVRDRLVLVAGGTQLTDEVARACGMDAGFGRGTTGQDVASFLVRHLREAEGS